MTSWAVNRRTLTTIEYSVKNGTINQENPGVFYYWVRITPQRAATRLC